MGAVDTVEPIIVLQSGGPPHARRNPYVTQLLSSLPESVRPLYFSWRRALAGHFDVFHVHWPDAFVLGRTPARTAARSALYLLVLLRVRVQHKALVRTLHDLEPYDRLPVVQRGLIRLSDRWTTLWIALTDVTPPPTPAPTVTAPIGHYLEWFRGTPRAARVAGRVLHFGLLRRYKGVESLLRAFSRLDDPRLTLRIVGHPQDSETAAAITRSCQADERLSAVTEYVTDEQLVREVSESELVVLPFDRVTNSSSAILALSLDRPVLIPSTPITERLADEVGAGWVITYQGMLDPSHITKALEVARQARNGPAPDLSQRDWKAIGAQHAAAFDRAVRIARQGRSRRRERNSRAHGH